MSSSEFRRRARESLSGNWFVAVIAGFIASLLGGVGAGSGSVSFDFSSEDLEGVDLEAILYDLGITKEMLTVFLAFIGVLAIVGFVYSIICLIIGSGVSVGYAKLNLDIVDGGSASVGTIFSMFGRWKSALWARILVNIRVMLWSLLFVIPGIVASYSYAMVSFVLADHPEMTASEALAESKRIMKGNRWRLFCLNLSFIGWSFLCIFTLGIGYIWLLPYTQVANAAFYREVKSSTF